MTDGIAYYKLDKDGWAEVTDQQTVDVLDTIKDGWKTTIYNGDGSTVSYPGGYVTSLNTMSGYEDFAKA